MAASDARPVPRKNTAYRVTFPLYDADGDLVTAAGSLDSEVSIDGGTFADCTNEATEIATSSGVYYLDLTAAEMNGDTVAVIVKSTGAKTLPLVFYPEEAGDIRVDVVQISGDTTAADNAELMFDGTGYAGGTTKLGVDVVAISGDSAAADNLESYTDGTTPIPANATQISGDATAADNLETMLDGTGGQTITLKSLVVSNSTGNAVSLTSSGGNGHGLEITGHGTGHGLHATGGATGDGIRGTGGATSGDGMHAEAPADGNGLHVVAVGSGNPGLLAQATAAAGASFLGGGANAGLLATGGATGDGIRALGGATSGDGLHAEAQASGDGIQGVGAGAGGDIVADEIAAIQADTNDIQTRIPAALVSGRMDASVGAYQSGLTPLQPTVSGRTLDVSAGGEAGIDWSNVGSPTSAVSLSSTTVGAVTAVTSISAGGVGLLSIAVAEANRLADIARRRTQANVEASSYGDTLDLDSAYGAIQAQLESAISGSTLTVKKTDGTTTLGTKTVTTSASADPVTGVS